MKVLFFDVGYTLVDESAVWEQRCKTQAETEEAKKLGLTAADIYHEVEKASIAGLPQYRTVIDKFRFKETARYQHELKLAKCRPEEACMIGDRMDNDVIPAKSIGMKTIWVKQGLGGLQEALAKENAPDFTVESLSELLEIL